MSKRHDIIADLLVFYALDGEREEHSLKEYAELLSSMTEDVLVETQKRLMANYMRRYGPVYMLTLGKSVDMSYPYHFPARGMSV